MTMSQAFWKLGNFDQDYPGNETYVLCNKYNTYFIIIGALEHQTMAQLKSIPIFVGHGPGRHIQWLPFTGYLGEKNKNDLR
jgi:hypothetical protein